MIPRNLAHCAPSYEAHPPELPVRGASLFIERLGNTKKELLTKRMDRRIENLRIYGKYLWDKGEGTRLLGVYHAIKSIRALKKALHSQDA